MNWIVRHRPSPALVIAVLALFVALSGLAVAGLKLPPKSVKTKNLKNAAVTEPKLANNAVTSSKIAAGAITKGKFTRSLTLTLDFAAFAGEGCSGISSPVSGVLASDDLIVTPPNNLPNNVLSWASPVDNQIYAKLCNVAPGTPDPPEGTWKFLIVR